MSQTNHYLTSMTHQSTIYIKATFSSMQDQQTPKFADSWDDKISIRLSSIFVFDMCLHNFSILKKFRISVNPISLSIFSIFRFRRRTAGTTGQVARVGKMFSVVQRKKIRDKYFLRAKFNFRRDQQVKSPLIFEVDTKGIKRKPRSSRQSLKGSRNVSDLKICGSLKKENCFYDAVERFWGGCGSFF